MPRWTTADVLREYLDLRAEASSEITNPALERRLNAAEAAAERYARRRFSAFPDPIAVPGGAIKEFTTRGRQVISVPDLRSIPAGGYIRLNGVDLTEDEWDPGDFWSEQPTTLVSLEVASSLSAERFARVSMIGRPFVRNDLAILGHWGFDPTPADVIEATYLMAARVVKRRDSGYSDQQVTESEIRSYLRNMPEEAKSNLDSYKKRLIGVA